MIEIIFNRSVCIKANKVYRIGMVLNKVGWYPMGVCTRRVNCEGCFFTFCVGQPTDTLRDGLIRSIIFSKWKLSKRKKTLCTASQIFLLPPVSVQVYHSFVECAQTLFIAFTVQVTCTLNQFNIKDQIVKTAKSNCNWKCHKLDLNYFPEGNFLKWGIYCFNDLNLFKSLSREMWVLNIN